MNLPNKLSISRIVMVPLMMVAFMVNFPGHMFVALTIFIVAAFTDFLDGKIARKYNLVTNLGKFLDPIADKMLTTTALMLLVIYLIIPNPYGIICLFLFVARDLIIDAFRQIAATKNCVLAASSLGKYKTFALDIALPILMLSVALSELAVSSTVITVISWIGFSMLIIATVLNVVSALSYILKNKQVFKD